MEKINWQRVLLGGLGWSVVFNLLLIWALALYLTTEMAAAWWGSWGVHQGFAVLWLVLTYTAGVVAIWLYAAIRPRYGSGPKTSVGAGLAFALIGSFMPMMLWGPAGVFPMRFVAVDVMTLLVLVVAATVVGASLYKEEVAVIA